MYEELLNRNTGSKTDSKKNQALIVLKKTSENKENKLQKLSKETELSNTISSLNIDIENTRCEKQIN